MTAQQALKVEFETGLAWLTIDHPPLNLMDAELLNALSRAAAQLHARDDVQVVVVQSEDPEFFCAHGDMRFATEPARLAKVDLETKPAPLNVAQAVNEQLRDLPQITIAKLAGFARGGGLELAMALDMRFAAKGKAFLAHTEATMGLMPGGGGSQYMTGLIGSARALELILTGQLITAERAEAWGLINRAMEPSELDAYVDALARRVAALEPSVARFVKVAVRAAQTASTPAGLAVEAGLFGQLVTSARAAEINEAVLAAGAQTREVERNLEKLGDQVLDGRLGTAPEPDDADR